MNFNIGQVFIEVNLLSSMKGITLRVIAPIGGTHMLKIGATIDNTKYPMAANIEVYERGDKNAEESAIN